MNFRKSSWRVYYELMPSFMKHWADDIMYRQSVPDALSRYLTEEERNDGDLVAQIKRDMAACRNKYHAEADEYFTFGFRNLNDEERSKFLTRAEKDMTLDKVIGKELMARDLRNKYNFYKMMKPYFGRDVMLIGGGIIR